MSTTALKRNEYEFHQEAMRDGVRLWVFVSLVGGGTSGKRYTGRWSYRIERAEIRDRTRAGRTKLKDGQMRVLSPMTHEQVASRIWDNLDSLLGDD